MYIQLGIQYELLPLKISHASVGTSILAELSQDVVLNSTLNLTDWSDVPVILPPARSWSGKYVHSWEL